MPFDMAPREVQTETARQRFARLIREGASNRPESDLFWLVGKNSCCAVGAAAFALGYHAEKYEGGEVMVRLLAQHGIPERLSMAASDAHYDLHRTWRMRGQTAPDGRLVIADMIERGEIA